ncbi:hypothetical protein LSM04_003003 [Trypanosoma melophagium]|uniref:uncharacterized protein n=1 Tax=Trypanosoma melophagium TaxID=715481 RepID=UPI00351A7429|nr:hypothetical protein LSM04_003003 [Trypanosoma melophagium]
MTLEEKVNVLTRFTKMLLQRLQEEQRQRLRVEEQTVRMASEHDQLVRALESRIKSVEGNNSIQIDSYYQNELYNCSEESCDTQLASLTVDFQQSIAQWNTLPMNTGKVLREEDFYTD